MKTIIFYLLIILTNLTFSQNIFNGVEYQKCVPQKKYSDNYNNIIFKNKNALIINIIGSGELGSIKRSIIFDKEKIIKIERSSNYLSLRDDYLKLYIVDKDKEEKFYTMLDIIIKKKYLQTLKQQDLDIDSSKDYLMDSHCGTSFIEFYQGNKCYKLSLYCKLNYGSRDKVKIDLYNELYKLLEDAWNIQNGIQGRSISKDENKKE